MLLGGEVDVASGESGSLLDSKAKMLRVLFRKRVVDSYISPVGLLARHSRIRPSRLHNIHPRATTLYFDSRYYTKR